MILDDTKCHIDFQCIYNVNEMNLYKQGCIDIFSLKHCQGEHHHHFPLFHLLFPHFPVQ